MIICPVCRSTDIHVFVNILEVPIHCHLIYKTYDKALQVPKGDIRLGFCRLCEHVFNYAFEPERMEYDQDYENSLHFSPRFQEYARSLATRLINHYDLNGKEIIEIGCGKGDFLFLLCEQGRNRGIGFDPSSRLEINNYQTHKHVTIVTDFYSEKYSNYQADLIVCRHVLEHIQFPRDFLVSVRNAAGNHMESVVYFEVPNVTFTLRDLGIWDLIYEHCSYFSTKSLVYLFSLCGFQVRKCTEAFDDQFLSIEAILLKKNHQGDLVKPNNIESLRHNVDNFVDAFNTKIKYWKRNLAYLKEKGKKAIIWGAGSKAVTFLNVLGVGNEIEHAVDINPKKHGNYIAGTGQKIVPPSFLSEYLPDFVIVMNPIYHDEIERMMREINITAEIMLV